MSLSASIPYSSHLAKNASELSSGLPSKATVTALVSALVITVAWVLSKPAFSCKNLFMVSDTPVYVLIIEVNCEAETSPPVISAVRDAVILSLTPS